MGARDIVHLQELLVRCSEYFELISGQSARPGEAEELLTERPRGSSAADKHVCGVFDRRARHLIGVLDWIRGYPAENDWWLGLLLLDPEVRGQGLGGRLVSASAAWLSQQGAQQLWLCVQEQNSPAAEFWRRLGFEDVRTERQRLGALDNTITVMRRAVV